MLQLRAVLRWSALLRKLWRTAKCCCAAGCRPIWPTKSKLAAVILAFLLGTLGIHNFYLGYTNKGIAQLLLTLLGGWLCGAGAIAAGIWALVEAIQLLTGSIHQDANGVPLKMNFNRHGEWLQS